MEPYLGEIRMVGFSFAPRGWAFCNGQVLPIHQNQALFSILGTTYGGDGRTTFALPDLRSRAPIHAGNVPLGTPNGEEVHTLSSAEMPVHTHRAIANTDANSATLTSPAGNLWANGGQAAYAGAGNGSMASAAVGQSGNSQAHDNMSPYLVVNFIIAVQGIFPSRN
jgi:microcystin-dependent protein